MSRTPIGGGKGRVVVEVAEVEGGCSTSNHRLRVTVAQLKMFVALFKRRYLGI